MSQALKRKRILLTRSSRDNRAWIEELATRGIEGIDLPCIQTTLLQESAGELANNLRACDGLLFSSPRAVRAVTQLCPDVDLSNHVSGCVGDATAKALEEAGGRVQFTSPEGTAHSLGQAWIERIAPNVLPLWPRAFDARAELIPLFEEQDRKLESLPVYRTSARVDIDRELVEGKDALFFASPSAVIAFLASGQPPAHTPVISIGPSTTQVLESRGVSVAAEARTRDLNGMLEALESCLAPLPNPDRPSS